MEIQLGGVQMSEQPRRRRRQQIVMEEPQKTPAAVEEVLDEPAVT